MKACWLPLFPAQCRGDMSSSHPALDTPPHPPLPQAFLPSPLPWAPEVRLRSLQGPSVFLGEVGTHRRRPGGGGRRLHSGQLHGAQQATVLRPSRARIYKEMLSVSLPLPIVGEVHPVPGWGRGRLEHPGFWLDDSGRNRATPHGLGRRAALW